MTVASKIRSKLELSLAPVELEIVDESHRHAGHSGAQPGGETHFNVRIVSAAFEGKNRVERHRMIFGALQELMNAPVHALSLNALAPAEAASR